jgi:hypothetical protein
VRVRDERLLGTRERVEAVADSTLVSSTSPISVSMSAIATGPPSSVNVPA